MLLLSEGPSVQPDWSVKRSLSSRYMEQSCVSVWISLGSFFQGLCWVVEVLAKNNNNKTCPTQSVWHVSLSTVSWYRTLDDCSLGNKLDHVKGSQALWSLQCVLCVFSSRLMFCLSEHPCAASTPSARFSSQWSDWLNSAKCIASCFCFIDFKQVLIVVNRQPPSRVKMDY